MKNDIKVEHIEFVAFKKYVELQIDHLSAEMKVVPYDMWKHDSWIENWKVHVRIWDRLANKKLVLKEIEEWIEWRQQDERDNLSDNED